MDQFYLGIGIGIIGTMIVSCVISIVIGFKIMRDDT